MVSTRTSKHYEEKLSSGAKQRQNNVPQLYTPSQCRNEDPATSCEGGVALKGANFNIWEEVDVKKSFLTTADKKKSSDNKKAHSIAQ